ncbi:MAG: porin [Deltaproteobacteria bacterium]|nr:porin [Deltaproteobacteria bacterium]
MSTRAGTLVAAAVTVLLAGSVGVASADEVEAKEVIVGEERVEAPAAAPDPEPEEECCTIPPLQYFDRTVNDVTSWLAEPGREIILSTGLSTAFQWDFNDPPNGKIPYRALSTNEGDYEVELFQLRIGYNLDPEPGEVGGNVTFDAGRIARNVKADWNGSGVIPDTDWEHQEAELQEAYLLYNVPVGNGITLKGGRFSTLLGAEVIEPWLNPNFSRGYLFGYAIPFTHTGGYATYPLTEMVSLSMGGVIGWDNVTDNNARPSGIGQIALTPSKYATLTLSGIAGPEQTCAPKPGVLPTLDGQGCNENMRGVFDAVLNVMPMEDVGVILNFDYGSESQASLIHPGRHAPWVGFSGIATYQLDDCFSFALRGEWFQDPQAARLKAVNDAGDLTGATVWDVTFDAKAMLSEYIYLRAEYRYDGSNQKIFTSRTNDFDEIALRGQNTVAVELGYYF